MFKFAKNALSKNPIIFKVFLEKILKFFLYYWIFALKVTFLLVLLLNYCFAKKKGDKKDLIRLIGLDSLKTIFILLAKTIAI